MYQSASLLDDYLYRPSCMELICLYEFVMRYKRCPINRNSPMSDCRPFKPEHPLHQSHCLSYRKKDNYAVPVVSGPRLKCVSPELCDREREFYEKCALVLFRTFRAAADLLAILTDCEFFMVDCVPRMGTDHISIRADTHG